MEKWEKTIFWIILVTIGILVIGSLLGFYLMGLIGAVILIDILIILETATKDMQSKWKAFGIRSLIMFFVTMIFGLLFGISEEGIAKLFSIIILIDLIQTATKKKINVYKKHK